MYKIETFTVCGHRGAKAVRPENTISSFMAAAEADAGMVETDIHMSADGELFLLHDDTLDRTTDRRGAVRELKASEILEADAGAWFSPKYAGERVPTLRALFEALGGTNIAFNLELKDYSSLAGREFSLKSVDRTLAAVEEYGFAERCVLNSFSAELLEYVDSRAPGRYAMHGFYPFSRMFGASREPSEYLTNATVFNMPPSADASPVAPKEYFDALLAHKIAPWLPSLVCEADTLAEGRARGALCVTANDPAKIIGLKTALSD